MRTWDLPLSVDERTGIPVFLQIARGISDGVRAGRLRPGDVLPGSRPLAASLGVHRNTVLAALRELRAEGWIETRPGGGTFVRRDLPKPARRFAPPGIAGSLGFDLPDPAPPVLEVAPRGPGILTLGEGMPDVRHIPHDALSRAFRRALRARKGAALGYADPRGHERLLVALSGMLAATRAVTANPATMIVTRGSQQAIDLVARALIRPGDAVAVEALGYRPAWTALELAGAALIDIPIDGEGLRIDALEAAVAGGRVRAVYLTPHHQYPTTVTLSAARRLQLLALARKHRLAVIEDDYDHEFHYDGRPILPLASADPGGNVIYVGTLSKILAPGLRLGFAVGPAALIDRLVLLRLYADRQGDQVMEAAVAELIEDGELLRHARRMRGIYAARREVLAQELRSLPCLEFDLPAGGIGVWTRVDPSVDVAAWQARAAGHGVSFRIGRQFSADAVPPNALRLGFAALDEGELAEAVRRMRRAL
jgi:GntR family transcriptional regulator/MocR family aminotransferase